METEVLLNKIRKYDKECIVSSIGIVLDHKDIDNLYIYIQSNSGIDTSDNEQDTNDNAIDPTITVPKPGKRKYKRRGQNRRRGKKKKQTPQQKEERRQKNKLKKAEEIEQGLRDKIKSLKAEISAQKAKVKELE